MVLGVNLAFGQKTVAADSLQYYKGDIVKVCEKVTTTFVTMGQEKTTILNIGPEFPHQFFTVIIYQEHLSNFSYDPATFLKDKLVCIIGDVRLFHSGPEIIVEREDQIRVENTN
jgi:hypothetical protein